MSEFIEEIRALITEYDSDYTVSTLNITLAIEIFSDIRNYPKSYTDAMKLEDMRKNSSKIAMAAIELDAKSGIENQTAHSENGTSRTYSKSLMAFDGVIGFATTI